MMSLFPCRIRFSFDVLKNEKYCCLLRLYPGVFQMTHSMTRHFFRAIFQIETSKTSHTATNCDILDSRLVSACFVATIEILVSTEKGAV